MAHSFDLDGIDTEQIGRLMDVLAEGDVEECEIEQGEYRLWLRRRVDEGPPPNEGASSPMPAEKAAPQEQLVIRAPAVGVFSRSGKPSAPSQVEIGGRVKAGDVLGYIEVMMIPHSVLSTHEGVVESFLVEDGQPVEYGQPLVALRPSNL